MEPEEKTATETDVQPIAAEELESKVTALEAEKAKLLEEKENYRKAYLKADKKPKTGDDEGEGDDERIRRITQETLAESRLADIARELSDINTKALKENKELKLALQNKTKAPPAAMGTHSETIAVADTLVTAEQIAALRQRGFTDKDIERYKQNLQKKI